MPLVNDFDKEKLQAKSATSSAAVSSGEPLPPEVNKSMSTFTSQRARSPYGGGLTFDRKSFILTSDLWQRESKALLLHAGPSEAQWSVGIRASTEDIKGGRAHYMQARPLPEGNYTYFNLPSVAFTFQSGNILPIPLETAVPSAPTAGTASKGAAVPYGLQDFYYFMQLVNQPPMLPRGQNEGKHNYLWVYYSSLQFPNIVLKGFIEPEGVTWSDTADAPNSFTWSATMAVYESTPDITESELLLEEYLENITIF